jgi:hypothetical protein
MDDLLQQGITAYKAGKRDEARKLFITAVKQSPDNELAWGWMYQVSNDDNERIYCMKQALRINPANEKAKQMLDALTEQDFPFEPLQKDSPPIQAQKNTIPPIIRAETPVAAQRAPVSSQQINTPPAKTTSTNVLLVAVVGVVVFCVVCGIIGLLGSGGTDTGRKVKYVVTGNVGTSSVSYTNETGGLNSVDVYLPFQTEVTLKESGFVSLQAWPSFSLDGANTRGTLTCELWVNGELKDTETANNAIALCGGYVP